MAYAAMLMLNSEKVQKFIVSIAFLDAKRPYTKKVLERIDFDKITRSVTFEELAATEKKLGLASYITMHVYDAFRALVRRKTNENYTAEREPLQCLQKEA